MQTVLEERARLSHTLEEVEAKFVDIEQENQ